MFIIINKVMQNIIQIYEQNVEFCIGNDFCKYILVIVENNDVLGEKCDVNFNNKMVCFRGLDQGNGEYINLCVNELFQSKNIWCDI